MSKAVKELLADGRPPPKACYLAGLAEHEWPGRPSPEETAAAQRERLLAAASALFAEQGFYGAAIAQIVERANVSPHTFYEFFEGKQDCFRIAFDLAAAQLRDRVETALAEAGPGWRDRMRAGIAALLRFLGSEPDLGRLLLSGSRSAPLAELQHRDALLEEAAGCIDALVRGQLAKPPAALAAGGLVGGIESVLYDRLQQGGTVSFDSLLPALSSFAVLVFAGAEAAAQELGEV